MREGSTVLLITGSLPIKDNKRFPWQGDVESRSDRTASKDDGKNTGTIDIPEGLNGNGIFYWPYFWYKHKKRIPWKRDSATI